MGKAAYSISLVKELWSRARDPKLAIRYRPVRYEPGDVLTRQVTGVFPAVEGQAELTVEKFLGGGFAGQVYRCRLTALNLESGEVPGLEVGQLYAVKIIIPPTPFSRFFRNFVYWLAFQGPFSSQVNLGACRSGLIWQKMMRVAGKITFGRDTAIKDAYASFWDPELQAYGEITEWIEGRTWLLEADSTVRRGVDWKTVDLDKVASAEFVAKRRFMADMVKMLHEMGAPEFARQYEWWTMKSQPNVLKRTDTGEDYTPSSGLCAIDFRAGLALLPFLPMSPGDIPLIFSGLFKRRTFVQFDRCNLDVFAEFVARHPDCFEEMKPALEELREQDRVYRRSLPDVTHHGWRLLVDRELRRDVRAGLVEGYKAADLVDEAFGAKLRGGGLVFMVFYVLGMIPVLGRVVRRLWGSSDYRTHIGRCLCFGSYCYRTLRAKAAYCLIDWVRAGRVGESHARWLADHPLLFWFEKFTLGLMPIAGLHRIIINPRYIVLALAALFIFIRDFCTKSEFRERWFVGMIDEGQKDGMLTAEQHDSIVARVKDPFIVKYLKCLAVHFATLPVTQVVSVTVGAIVAGWLLARGEDWEKAVLAFGGIVAFFQFFPVSPGSICRGLYVVMLMIKERNLRGYLIAAPLSFVKYIGYLAFPLQMVTTYPTLAQFLASNWATKAVHFIPVFGEKGALLEHWVFDLCFNVPQLLGSWVKPRLKGLLTTWMLIGVALVAILFHYGVLILHSESGLDTIGINVLIATVVLFVLPRLVFLPLLSRKV